MLYVVTGGSGSGKSEYAENLAVSLGESRVYVATMQVFDEEDRKRVDRHRKLREGKQFVTIECPLDLEQMVQENESEELSCESVALLECMSNLLANEMFRPDFGFCSSGGGRNLQEKTAAERILSGVERLQKVCCHLVIVTNEVFSDGTVYEPETMEYIRCLGMLNRTLASMADQVTEVVCGIPVIRKRKEVQL